MKKLEMFQELSVKLAVIDAKLDKLLEAKSKYTTITPPSVNVGQAYDSIPCIFDNIDITKSMGLVCPCRKCSPYALSSGSLVDSGLKQ